MLRVDADDASLVWEAISAAIAIGRIAEIRRLGDDEFLCGVPIEVVVGHRRAPILTAWHYDRAGADPRLVTAYPRPYTRKPHGEYA